MPVNSQPVNVKLKAGQAYSYCPCYKTKTPPWCDMSHRGHAICPIPLQVDNDQCAQLCQCGQSSELPFCDGSHGRSGDYSDENI